MKKEITPNITVAICTYNQSAMLENTLDSINRQKLSSQNNVNIVVVDNNSSDSTQEVCERFSKNAQFAFSYYFEAEQGLSFARNRAMQEAGDGVIIFTDDDVLVSENWLQGYADEYADETVSAVFGPIIPEWNGNKPEWFTENMSASYALLDYGDKRFIANTEDKEFFGANFSCYLSLLKDTGGFDTQLGRKGAKLFIGEETEIFLKLLKLNKVVVYNPDIYVWHVIREDRKSKAFIIKYYNDIADSSVYATLKKSRRLMFGIPLYKYREFAHFYALYALRIIGYSLTGQSNKKFQLKLNHIKNARMIKLYWQNRSRIQHAN